MLELKNYWYICALVLLIGMIFTVVQNVPLQEELTQKTEITKKLDKEGDTEDSETDSDDEDESGDFFSSKVSLEKSAFSLKSQNFIFQSHRYLRAQINIVTPPPEI